MISFSSTKRRVIKHSTKDENNDNVKNIEVATQIKSDINANKNNLLITYDREINNYNQYQNNNKKPKKKYFESSIKNNKTNTDAKATIVNNPLTYQTNTNQIKVDKDKLEQDFVENKTISMINNIITLIIISIRIILEIIIIFTTTITIVISNHYKNLDR